MSDLLNSKMPREALCDFCSTLDFNVIGFYDHKLLLNNTFPRNRSLRAILDTVSSCIFCKQIVSVCRRWNICKDRDLASLQDAEAEAEIDIRRQSTVWTIKDQEYLPMASINYLTVEIIMKKERMGDPFTGFGPFANFQRCEIPLHDVTECLDGTVLLEGDQYQPHQGRLRPLVADLRLFRAWKEICAKREPHQKACGHGAYPANLFLRFIDVEQRRVISGCHGLPFVALSYVWGTDTKPCLTKESLDLLMHPNALRQDNNPPTIFDAFTITEALGERYLWVDSCCIIQDDEQDKLKHVSQMDLIYNLATVTIIASSGKSATSGLPGVRPDSRYCEQRPFIAKGLQLVETLSPGDYGGRDSYKGKGLWKQRGWTFQERLMSRRCLVFTEEQVYWVCQKARFSEDQHAESPFVPGIIVNGDLERPRMGAERVAAVENVPALVTANSLARVALTFWTRISRIKVDGGEVEPLSKLGICGLDNATKMQVDWYHIPFGITTIGSKSFYAVVVGDSGRRNHQSLAIILVSWEDGIAYREGMLNINESDWLSLDREWKQITLC